MDPKSFQLACANCSLAQLCLPLGLSVKEVVLLDELVQRRRILKNKEFLFHEQDIFKGLYAIRSGSFKSVKSVGDEERIVGLYLPGELLGFHAISTEHYQTSAIALETSSVCEIPFDKLFAISSKLPSLQKHLLALMSEKLSHDYAIDPNSSAQERIARFLLSVSGRLSRRGLSASQFHLSMSREDIGAYLGLAPETVSRQFAKLQKDGVLRFHRRDMELLDIRRLQILSCIT